MKQKCGCGRHMLDLEKEDVVSYRGEVWKLHCLFLREDRSHLKLIDKYDALEKRCKLAERTARMVTGKMLSMKKYLAKDFCHGCGFRVGNRFYVDGVMILCSKCSKIMSV